MADGIENAGDAMRDVVLHHIAYKKHRDEDTHNGIDEIKEVEAGGIEAPCQQRHNLVDEPVKHVGSHRREQSHEERQHEHEHALTNMSGAP